MTASPTSDLHVHTHLSDGLASPERVLREAARLGLTRIALTDHDGVDAHLDATVAGLALELKVELVTGVEVDCHHDGVEPEVLGFDFDPYDAPLGEQLRRVQAERRALLEEIVARFIDDGCPLDADRVLGGPSVALMKKHLFDELGRLERPPASYRAFKDEVRRLGPYQTTVSKPTPVQAVQLVVAAGGRAVLAHPGYLPPATLDSLVPGLADAGLWGLELGYAYHASRDGWSVAESRARIGELAALAERFGLRHTAGTDTHDLAEWPARLAALAEAQRWIAEAAGDCR